MANFPGLSLTTFGINLLAKAQTGTTLQFNRVGIGDGTWSPGQLPEAVTGLVNEVRSLALQGHEIIGDGTTKITVMLSNIGLPTGFFVREIGLFAQDPTLGEILYAVAYAGDQYDYVPPEGATTVEEVIELVSVIGNAQNVTAVLSDTVLLATKQDIQTHDQNPTAHGGILGFRVFAKNPANRTFSISQGFAWFNDIRLEFPGNSSVDLGPAGAFESTAMTAGYFRKILFCMDDTGSLVAIEGAESATEGGAAEPALPLAHFPLCVVTVQDDGNAGAGTIEVIGQADIEVVDGLRWFDLRYAGKSIDEVITQTGGTPDPADSSLLWDALNTLAASRGTNRSVFSGNGTFTVPTDITRIVVELWGGGGGGGGANVYLPTGGGGGAGGYGSGAFTVVPAEQYTVTVGAGGTSVAVNTASPGGVGGTTSFGALLSATGGSGGQPSTGSGGSGGAGGSGSGGDLGITGSQGDTTSADWNFGTGGAAGRGGGGGAAYQVGGAPGGGGGGGNNEAGSGAGGSGLVIVYY